MCPGRGDAGPADRPLASARRRPAGPAAARPVPGLGWRQESGPGGAELPPADSAWTSPFTRQGLDEGRLDGLPPGNRLSLRTYLVQALACTAEGALCGHGLNL